MDPLEVPWTHNFKGWIWPHIFKAPFQGLPGVIISKPGEPHARIQSVNALFPAPAHARIVALALNPGALDLSELLATLLDQHQVTLQGHEK